MGRMFDKFFFVLVFALSLLVTAPAVCADEGEATVPEPSTFEKVLAKIVTQIISSQHYTRDPFNDSMSSRVFSEYFDVLDRERQFFLASDIEEFSNNRYRLDDQLMDGNLEFAYDVYARFLQRVRERTEYARARLREPFDFTVDEALLLDRSEEPWCKNTSELDEIWRRQLKNKVLVYTLMDEKPDVQASSPAETGEEDAREARDDEATDQAARDDAAQAETEADPGSDTNDASIAALMDLSPEERTLRSHERFLGLIEQNESIDVLELFLSALAHVYDPHSTYMAPSTEEDFDINMSLSLEGIGAVLTTEEGYVKIVDIIPGGPAERDGRLRVGDRIVAVRQEDEEAVDVINMPLRKVVQMIRGTRGTTVILTVIEAGNSLSSVPVTIDIVRDEVKLTAREAKSELRTIQLPIHGKTPHVRDGNETVDPERQVLVIRLPSFYADFQGKRDGNDHYKSASRDVHKILEDHAEDGIDGVILDLRSNGGGSLEEAVKVAGLFFDKGPVVQVRSAGKKTEVYRDPEPDTVYSGPLVIMVDRLSASASEIVSACIQDYKRGVLVGESSTHGKGTVQTVLDLNRFFSRHPVFKDEKTGALKFTIAKFYRVNGDSTQVRGVIPDITMASFHDKMRLGEDSLENALPWDSIEPQSVQSPVDVSPFIPILKQCSQTRLEANDDYDERVKLVDRFAAWQERTTLTLNKEKRLALQEDEEELMDRVRASNTIRDRDWGMDDDAENDGDKQETEKTDETDETQANDLLLAEALNVMGDLLWLQEGELIAHPRENAENKPPLPEDDDATAAVDQAE